MTEYLEQLIYAYVVLNKIHAEPGAKCHMLAGSIKFIERQIKEVLKVKFEQNKLVFETETKNLPR